MDELEQLAKDLREDFERIPPERLELRRLCLEMILDLDRLRSEIEEADSIRPRGCALH